MFAIKARESVLLIRGCGKEEKEDDEEKAPNDKCSITSSMANTDPDAFVLAPPSKQKLHPKPGGEQDSRAGMQKREDPRMKRNAKPKKKKAGILTK